MKLHEKIAHLRKENGWSQEAFAERMNVSRQAVSKWEAGASNPDLENILTMCRLFGVSADALLREDVAIDGGTIIPEDPKRPRLSMDDSYTYISDRLLAVQKTALAVALCVVSPAPVVLLAPIFSFGGAMGTALLLLIVALAVYLLIMAKTDIAQYRYIERGRFTPVPGIAEWVNESLTRLRPRFVRDNALGVMLCIVCPAPVILLPAIFRRSSAARGFGLMLLFVCVAAACYLFVRNAGIQRCYRRLLRGKR